MMLAQRFNRFVSLVVVFTMVFSVVSPALAQTADTQASSVDAVATGSTDALQPATNSDTVNATNTVPVQVPVEQTEAVSTTTPDVNTASTTVTDDTPPPAAPVPSYTELMRTIAAAKQGSVTEKQTALESLNVFIASEKEKLKNSTIDSDHQSAYINFLELQRQVLGESAPISTMEKISNSLRSLVGMDTPKFQELQSEAASTIAAPLKPATFEFSKEDIVIHDVSEIAAPEKKSPPSVWESVWGIPAAAATSAPQLPTLDDVVGNDEVVISTEMKELVTSLHNNPVEIINYLRKTIAYESYYGSKKGSVGCLAEKACNDVDASSLTIALMRAAGIPARYKKTIAVMPVAQWQNILGVADTKTAFAALAFNQVPVYVLSGNNVGQNLDAADLSQEKSLAAQWVYPEIFYTYDERAGHIPNTLNLAGVTTTNELQNILVIDSSRQWIPTDVVVKPYKHTAKTIVADVANFNTQTFWNNYLSYQGNLSPIAKYADDLKNQTGKDPLDPLYQSTKIIAATDLAVLPPTLPYYTGIGQVGNLVIQPETWSVLPNQMRQQVTITLLRNDNKQTVLTHTFYGNEINNIPYTLNYVGATAQDAAIIEQNGGIASTPAALVAITPVLSSGGVALTTQTNVAIGDALILQFDFAVNGKIEESNQKFSVAGNEEGIYVALSKVQTDPSVQTPAQALLRGTAEMARQYLAHQEAQNMLLKQSLDYEYEAAFSRAVVTQNRVLNMVNGVPTTFDFKGLTLDASMQINDYSNSGGYKTHRPDFRLLLGLDASYYEAQLFADLAGLNGISTVKGLQYAAVNPGVYTVSTFTSSTPNFEQTINGFTLPTSTRQSLIAEIKKGNTVITPNKMIVNGEFTGVVYISLNPNSTGTYAIGDQVQNGGWTVNKFTLGSWNNDVNQPQYAYQYINGPQQFIYKDNTDKNIFCSIKVNTYNQIVGGNLAAGWDVAKYGKPCMDDNENGPYKFGNHDHSLIVATNGAYFKSVSDNYAYWEKDLVMLDFIKLAIPEADITMRKVFPYWGTYVAENVWPGFSNSVGLALFSPAKRQAYVLEYLMENKYTSGVQLEKQYIPSYLGYPIAAEQTAATSPNGTSGYYQQFTNGTMYLRPSLSNFWNVFIVYGLWNDKHSQLGGTGGAGFPDSDASINAQNLRLTQKFENQICEQNNGAVTCAQRTFFGDIKRGLSEFYNSLPIALLEYNLYTNNLVLKDYNYFINNVNSAADTPGNRAYFCLLYQADYARSSFIFTSNLADVLCAFPGNMQYYKGKISNVQSRITALKNVIATDEQVAQTLHSYVVNQIENSNFTGPELLGYYAVDIATAVVSYGAALGATATKEASLSVVTRYSTELADASLSKNVIAENIGTLAQKNLQKEASTITAEVLDDALDQAATKAVKNNGSYLLTPGENPIRYKITPVNTTVSPIPGGTNISSQLGKQSFIQAQVVDNGGLLRIIDVNRGSISDQAFHTSNALVDQYLYVGGRAGLLKKIEVDTIVEKNTLDLINSNGSFVDSKWGSILKRIANGLNRDIDWNKTELIFDLGEKPPNVTGFNAIIYFK